MLSVHKLDTVDSFLSDFIQTKMLANIQEANLSRQAMEGLINRGVGELVPSFSSENIISVSPGHVEFKVGKGKIHEEDGVVRTGEDLIPSLKLLGMSAAETAWFTQNLIDEVGIEYETNDSWTL